MIELILIFVISVGVVVLYERRLQKAEKALQNMESFAADVCAAMATSAEALRSLGKTMSSHNRVLDMHNDTLGRLVPEVDDLQKFITLFRDLRNRPEVLN
jgi:tRNA A58 N-methylase Trm61